MSAASDILQAAKNDATLGKVLDVYKRTFGVYERTMIAMGRKQYYTTNIASTHSIEITNDRSRPSQITKTERLAQLS